MRNSLIQALAITLILLSPAWNVQAQGDLDLLSSAAPPNVMLLFDNSGSMNRTVTGHPDYNSKFFYDRGPAFAACGVGGSTQPAVPIDAGTTGLCPASGEPDGSCPDENVNAESEFSCSGVPGGCANVMADWDCSDGGGSIDIETDGIAQNWTRNFMWFYLTGLLNGNPPVVGTQTRLTVAKDVVTQLINDVNPDKAGGGYTEKVRFGIATFDQGAANGAIVRIPITPGNKPALLAYVATITAGGWTPLSESLVDIGRYFAGSKGLGTYATYNRLDNTGSIPGSPINATCNQNFVVIMTDGEPTQDLNNHHGVAVGGQTYFSDFGTTIGDADGDLVEIPDPSVGYGSFGTDWLDDVSYYLRNADLSNLASTQNLITYTVGFTIDHPLLQDTADNSTGLYFTTNEGSVLVTQLSQAIQDIIGRATTFSGAQVPSSRSAFGDGFYTSFFIPSLVEGLWEGHLQAFRLSQDLVVLDRNGNPAIDSVTNLFIEPRDPFWDVHEKLSNPAHPPRKLYTTRAGARIDFTKANIAAVDLGVLASDLTSYPGYPQVTFADAEALTDGIVDYLEGYDTFDLDEDGNTTELKDLVFGDIFHSAPVIIGPPPLALSGEPGFGPESNLSSFLAQYAKRKKRLYVGANDGMLHAIDAGEFRVGDNLTTPEMENGYYDLGTGEEVFGYIPGYHLGRIKDIPQNFPRQFWYVDGNPVAADAWFPSTPSDPTKDPDEWTTVLMTGMREGGSAYIALDVTDPDATTGKHGPYPKFLWELDTSSIPMGDSWSEPVITRIKVKAGSTDLCGKLTMDDGPCREQWVAIFGGGYRDDGNPNSAGYVDDPASVAWSSRSKNIFMVALDTGTILAQVVFDPDPTKTLYNMRYSLPSDPAVLDLDFDGYADVVYIGDLGGQLWRWDISAVGDDTSSPADGMIDNWPVGLFFKSEPALLSGGGKHYHSIFFPPAATYLNGELVLAFGSGERTDLTFIGDPAEDEDNRFWVVWDRVALGEDPEDPNSGWLTLFEDHSVVNGATRGLNDVTNVATDPFPDDDGYYIKVPDGEKFITNHIIFAGILITLSYVPDPGGAGSGNCGVTGTTNVWLFNLDDAGGLLDASAAAGNDQRNTSLGFGVPTDPQITVTKDKVILMGQTSMGNIFEMDLPVSAPSPIERVFWRQLF